MTKKEEARASVVMTKALFTEFALFDTFRLKKMWRKPALLTAVFIPVAVLAYFRLRAIGQSTSVAFLLLAFGFALPAYHFLRYMHSVNVRAGTMEGREVYSLLINKAGLTVAAPEDSSSEIKTMNYGWKGLKSAYRLKKSICIYTDVNHAFLFPQNNESSDEAWKIICRFMDENRVHGCKKT